jgi:hypothetical protein
MQTFIPYGHWFGSNALVLDRQRLGKQRVEGLQILNTLLGLSKGWANHPAVKMWEGYEEALAKYTACICDEWVWRGYQDTVKEKVEKMFPLVDLDLPIQRFNLPNFLFDMDVAISHRSNLIRKDPAYYGPLWVGVPNDLPYKWPVPKAGLS